MTLREFAEYVKQNGTNSGDAVCGIYKLEKRLSDGRPMVATFIEPYNNAPSELRIFVRPTPAAQSGVWAESVGDRLDTCEVFESGRWVSAPKRYSLKSYMDAELRMAA